MIDVATACLVAGAPAVQLRDKSADDETLLGLARALRRLCDAHRALLFVNDRADIALAAGADGVHLGPTDLAPEAVRHFAPPPFLIGWSTDQPADAATAAARGVDYIGCGAVFGTTTKPGLAGEAIGPGGLREVVAASQVPVVAIGGVTGGNATEAFRAGAAGVAVVRALMAADDPGEVTRSLLAAADVANR